MMIAGAGVGLIRNREGAMDQTARREPLPASTLWVDRDRTASERLAAYAVGLAGETLPGDVAEKAGLAFLDFLACAFEARELPWSRQARAFAVTGGTGPAAIIGARARTSPAEAAFCNGTTAHGLIREDMHAASNSHLGVVIWPTLLALLDGPRVRGTDFLAAGVAGYEVGARIGRTLLDPEIARRFRPTGITGPIGAAAAGARLLRLNSERAAAAIAFAANTVSGLNDWPAAGSTEVFFHAGVAARNAVTAALLAEAGLVASSSALDGEAGLYAAHRRQGQLDALCQGLGEGFEIREVYFKAAPACNYVQTACQAALALHREGVRPGDVVSVEVATFSSAARYPGCDHIGPFEHLIQAKMSIQFSIATVLVRGVLEEANYARLDEPETLRLAELTTLAIDPTFERAFPPLQGAEVRVTLRDGSLRTARRDDVAPCPPAGVRARFRAAAEPVLGPAGMRELEAFVDGLPKAADVSPLARLVAPLHG